MPTLVGKEVGPIGYGLMGLTWRPSPMKREDAFAAMDEALAQGANFWNGGEFYGPPESNSLDLLRDYFRARPGAADKVVLSIKGCADVKTLKPDGSEAGVRKSLDRCIEILDGTKKIDIFEPARIDPAVELEETFKTLQEYVDAGKIGGIGISEVKASTIRKISKIVKVASVEIELALSETVSFEDGVAATCAELNIPIVAYSPLGRSLLTGAVRNKEDASKLRLVNTFPRFVGENLDNNMKFTNRIVDFAEKKGVTPAQVAIGWLLSISETKGLPTIIPIPGTTSAERVKGNSKVVKLSEEDIKELDQIRGEVEIKGTRYPEHGMAFTDQ